MAELLEELLVRCRAGEQDAIDTLVRRFRSYAIGLAMHILGDRHLAEDATQNAFLAAIDRLDHLRSPAAFPGWLRQIVRTHATRIARRRNTSGHDDPHADATPRSPSHRAETEELRCRLRHAIASLPKPSREAAELYYLHEFDIDRAAAALDIPPGTVKRRLHDARRRLRSDLEDHLPL